MQYRFEKSGRYLVVCMNRGHDLANWMSGASRPENEPAKAPRLTQVSFVTIRAFTKYSVQQYERHHHGGRGGYRRWRSNARSSRPRELLGDIVPFVPIVIVGLSLLLSVSASLWRDWQFALPSLKAAPASYRASGFQLINSGIGR